MYGTATEATPCAATAGDRPAEEFITLAEASRLSGLHETTILRMALAGDIRHRVRGRRTLFSAEDVRRAAG
jgi:excisionase family DNA binding protein